MQIEDISRIVRQVIEEQQGNLLRPACSAVVSSRPVAAAPAAAATVAVPASCKAALLTGPKRIELREFPIRAITDDEILIRVEGCGICGTDVHEYKGDPMKLAPLVLGHEGTGEIVRLGKNVTRDNSGKPVKVGDKIVTSVTTCGKCDPCLYLPGRLNLCENLGVQGLFPDDDTHLNGYFAEYMIVRAGASFFVVNDLSLDLRMLIEPAVVVVHALERAKSTGLLNFRSRVLVQGCGPIGLLMLAVVRAAGTEHIVALDGSDSRLAMAKRMGAETVINYRNYPGLPDLIDAVKGATKGRGCHFAFQCTGVPAAASNIFHFVQRGGGVCEVGFFVDNGTCTVNPHQDFCAKEISLVGSWVYSVDEYPIAYNFLRRAQGIGLPVEELITHRFPLEKITEAMELNIRQEGLKVVVLPGAQTSVR
ncbi:theronine dehydrogenase-like Zn-dependent dehydrogenase [Opitutaceae bacterium TAV1]|nr:theronine dehydrogenase-like Zn-dependent dehydrogenase [Opitutaceae bacterium TAV1]